MQKKTVTSALVLGLGLAMAPAVAHAQSSPISGGYFQCSSGAAPKVRIQSQATGRINHSADTVTQGSWNNGSTYTYRYSPLGVGSVSQWKVFLTGSGGDISYGNAVCYGP